MLAAFLWIGVLFDDVYGFPLFSLHCVWFGASASQVRVRARACACLCTFVSRPCVQRAYVSACAVVEPNTHFSSCSVQDSSKSPRPMKKFLPGNRKKERKPSDDEIQTRKSEDSLLGGGLCVFVVLLFLKE